MEVLERWPKKDWQPRDARRAIGGTVIALLIAIGLFSSFYTVAPEEEAVVLRFGRYATSSSPGLHFKLPFGIDSAVKVPVTEVRRMEFGFRTREAARRSTFDSRDSEAIMLTGDLNIAEVTWVVQYRIKDAKDWLFHVKEQEDTIADLSESVMRAVVGDHTVTEVIGAERERIAQQAQEALQERLDHYGTGVQIVTIQLQNANPPKPVQPSFNEVNAAEQEKKQIENEAQREYNKVIAVARGDAKREVSEAKGYAVDRVNRAKGNVARFKELYEVYRLSKEVTRRRLYLETIEEVLPKVERVIVADEDGVLKLLPLQKGATR